MFLGRSEVTVHGPSLNRFSASRRRRRTASCVHASLRRMALWMGSASLSEISVIGVSALARIHEAPKIRSAAILTIAIVRQSQAATGGKRMAATEVRISLNIAPALALDRAGGKACLAANPRAWPWPSARLAGES